VDLFPYLQWNSTTSSVNLLVSRIPYARVMGEFTNSGLVAKGVFGIVNYNSGDNVVLVDRFYATLSAGAGHTWSGAGGVYGMPIYEGVLRGLAPTLTGFSAITTSVAKYQVVGDKVILSVNQIVGTSNTTGMTFTLPFTTRNTTQSNVYVPIPVYNAGAVQTNMGVVSFAQNSNIVTCFRNFDLTTLWTNSGLKGVYGGTITYYI
jgi:hypothetical protein